jgi:hypothetical protein
MAQPLRVIALQMGAAAAAMLRMVLLDLIAALDRQQLRPRSGMALLTTSLAATGFAACGRLKTKAITGGRFGGVAGVAADPLTQARQFRRQGGELLPQLIVLLLLGQKVTDKLKESSPYTHRGGGPVRF